MRGGFYSLFYDSFNLFSIRAFAFCWILEVDVNDIDILKEKPQHDDGYIIY